APRRPDALRSAPEGRDRPSDPDQRHPAESQAIPAGDQRGHLLRHGSMDSVLARNWGMIALRGVVAILFGVIAILNPAAGLAVLILLCGALAFADGVLAIVAAIANRNGERRWLALLVSGILAIVVGLIAFTRPALTTVVLVYLVAAWAIVAGV